MGAITSREYDILTRLHKNNEEIADELGITIYTVKAIANTLRKKFKVKTRGGVIIRALRLGIVDLKSFQL